ncbi:MAG: YtxH domain-containing protein [Marinilabilia sp.]
MKNTGLFLGGLILGAAAGAAIALLYTPQTGEDTRKQIKVKIDELEDELEKMRKKMQERGTEMKDEARKRMQELESRIERLMEEYKKAPEKAK